MKAADLKVGDRVKLTGEAWEEMRGRVVSISDNKVEPRFIDGLGLRWAVEEEGEWAFEFVSHGDDAVDPDHYRFPGGIQTHQISAHLTSLGGQALQYIARSTRLDGANKGDPVTDLRKAIRLLEWEIERIENT